MNSQNLAMVKTVVRGLGEKKDAFIFVGGVIVDLYANRSAAPESRPTIDVDCIVEITSFSKYTELESTLRNLGFRHDTRDGAPRCRWIYGDVVVDVMPTPYEDEFTNKWVEAGLSRPQDYQLDNDCSVKILPAPLFLATKLEAMKNRGLRDLRQSKDFEDIVFILLNRSNIVHEIKDEENEVLTFIATQFTDLLEMDIINEAIAAVLDPGEGPGTVRRVKTVMEEIRSLIDK
jgi:predicted nucleotidyltransferase